MNRELTGIQRMPLHSRTQTHTRTPPPSQTYPRIVQSHLPNERCMCVTYNRNLCRALIENCYQNQFGSL